MNRGTTGEARIHIDVAPRPSTTWSLMSPGWASGAPNALEVSGSTGQRVRPWGRGSGGETSMDWLDGRPSHAWLPPTVGASSGLLRRTRSVAT